MSVTQLNQNSLGLQDYIKSINPSDLQRIPKQYQQSGDKGVYFLFDDEDKLMYVGKSLTNIDARVANHTIRNYAFYSKLVLNEYTNDEVGFVEEEFIRNLLPPLNINTYQNKYPFTKRKKRLRKIIKNLVDYDDLNWNIDMLESMFLDHYRFQYSTPKEFIESESAKDYFGFINNQKEYKLLVDHCSGNVELVETKLNEKRKLYTSYRKLFTNKFKDTKMGFYFDKTVK